MRKPDFENLQKVFRREAPSRVTLFELFMNRPLYEHLAGRKLSAGADAVEELSLVADAYAAAGYDYASTQASDFHFPYRPSMPGKHDTISLNTSAGITSWEAFEKAEWLNPGQCDSSRLEKIENRLPEGMKLMVMGPCGVLENAIQLMGYDNLALMLYDNPELVQAVFDKVGSSLVQYYTEAAQYPSVGFLCSNDDWGFNTQTFLSPEDMRKYVFPWHKRIVQAAHDAGKMCVLHSCGNYRDVIGDIIEDMRYDARHSYEDNIVPVEEAYEDLHSRIAVFGGIDIGFLMRAPIEDVKKRCRAMIERTNGRGGWALGTGNSVPDFLPWERFFAMLDVAKEYD